MHAFCGAIPFSASSGSKMDVGLGPKVFYYDYQRGAVTWPAIQKSVRCFAAFSQEIFGVPCVLTQADQPRQMVAINGEPEVALKKVWVLGCEFPLDADGFPEPLLGLQEKSHMDGFFPTEFEFKPGTGAQDARDVWLLQRDIFEIFCCLIE